MNGLLFITICLVMGVLVRLVEAKQTLFIWANIVGTAILVLVLIAAPHQPFTFAGRTLSLDYTAGVFLLLAAITAAILAIFGTFEFETMETEPSRLRSGSQVSFLYWSLAPLAAAMAIDSFPLAVFFWALGLIILVLVAQPIREGRVGGAAQFLLITVVAIASLLLSNRFLELYPLTPENTSLVSNAVLFLTWGLGLLLAVAPLHLWLGPLSDEMPLLGMGFLLGVAQPVGLWLLFQLMTRSHWLGEKSPLLDVMLIGGALTIPVAALFSMAERRHGRLLAYLSMVSLGGALIGFGLGTRPGLASAILFLMNRAAACALFAGGLVIMRGRTNSRWRAMGAGIVLLGGYALCGLPPFPGAAGTWGAYQELAKIHPLLLAIVVASGVVAFLSVLRAVRPALAGGGADAENAEPGSNVPILLGSLVVGLVVLLILVGIFPSQLMDRIFLGLGPLGYLK